MNIREWYSNNVEFIKKIEKSLQGKEDKNVNTLGLSWQLDKDTLSLNRKQELTNAENKTKKSTT